MSLRREALERFKTFDGVHFSDPNGTQREYVFPNGYTVSVIRTKWSYGGAVGLFECGTTSPTKQWVDVEGWLDEDKVTEYLYRVYQLQ